MKPFTALCQAPSPTIEKLKRSSVENEFFGVFQDVWFHIYYWKTNFIWITKIQLSFDLVNWKNEGL